MQKREEFKRSLFIKDRNLAFLYFFSGSEIQLPADRHTGKSASLLAKSLESDKLGIGIPHS